MKHTESLTVGAHEFARFSEDNPDAALRCHSVAIQHEKLGPGMVESVTSRQGISPLFCIHFPLCEKTSKFNLSAFKSEAISSVTLPHPLVAELLTWRAESEKRESERAAAKRAAFEKLELDRKAELFARESRARLAEEERRERETQVIPFHGYMAEISPHLPAMEYMEKLAMARTVHNRSVLPPRIDWLKECSRNIQEGRQGPEPTWSRGQEAAAYLRTKGISHLWHFTDIRNLESIRSVGGLLSYEGVDALVSSNTKVWFSANDESVRRDRSLERQNSVRLSYVPNSFYFQRARRKAALVWLRFSPLMLALGEVSYSRGNAASEYADLCYCPSALSIDWPSLLNFGGCLDSGSPPLSYPTWYRSPFDEPEFVNYKKATLNSEILIKHFLSLDFCTGIWDAHLGRRIPFLPNE